MYTVLEHAIPDQRLVRPAEDRNLPGHAEQLQNFAGIQGRLVQRNIAADRGNPENIEFSACDGQHNGQRIVHSCIYIQNDLFTRCHP
ncbi:hypothetical protein D3C76_1693520 [compost metagenome]